ncbi:MAG TPA: helix-turn-helix transcriptional regulator [Solirubrobacterales bacterium]|nr:helix-turn-helix transcriptional regulator [Solirubrobacterales bacterium]
MPTADKRLLDLIGDTQGLLDLEEFRRGLVGALKEAVPSDWVSINDVGPGPGDFWALVEPAMTTTQFETFARYMHQNPLIAYMTEADRRGSARRLSDLVTAEELHALDLYRHFYGPIGLEYQIAFTLPQEPPRLLGVALSRRRRDFTDEERDLLNNARPYLIQGYRNAIAYERARRSGGAEALDVALRGAGLTGREAAVIDLIAHGRSTAAIADELGIATRTAEKHVQNAFTKLGVTRRSEAAERAWDLVASIP